MKTYFFDVRGTLVGNVGGLSEEHCRELVYHLQARGHRVIAWTNGDSDDVPQSVHDAVHGVILKRPSVISSIPLIREINGAVIVVDDDEAMLRLCHRLKAKTIHARTMGLWYQHQAEPAAWEPPPRLRRKREHHAS